MDILIYNFFPRLGGPFDRWEHHFERIASMGFNWLYFNPIFYPGFSGSLYAVKDFGRLDPVICPDGADDLPLKALKPVLKRAKAFGLRPMVDLVVNHTAIDSPLVETHPDWFFHDESGQVQSPFAIDPADARRKTVWGDLAELNHEDSSDPQGLKAFLAEIVKTCLDVGFEGFRCDAAYKVPGQTWRELTGFAREQLPDALFMAETLGCRPEEMMALEGAGFDVVMNSSKYWAFDAPWCLEQHREWQRIAPSVAFPESHDTPRLAAETGGLEQVQRQRLILSAVFSRGIMMPMGYEFGFRRSLNVVETRTDDWEEPSFDLIDFVRGLLELKRSSETLSVEGSLEPQTAMDQPTLVLEKRGGRERVLLLINKDWHQGQRLELAELRCASRLVRPSLDRFEPEPEISDSLELHPAEIAIAFFE